MEENKPKLSFLFDNEDPLANEEVSNKPTKTINIAKKTKINKEVKEAIKGRTMKISCDLPEAQFLILNSIRVQKMTAEGKNVPVIKVIIEALDNLGKVYGIK